MNRDEIRATAGLSVIYSLRMLGMFMILPVFALYARDLPVPATALQIGLAIGLYGLIQAALQIPFGWLSDRIGRKPVMVGGLALFALGSALAGATQDIHWIMAGRALQGTGAISGAASAWLADVTRPQVRSTAMAILGAGMGVSFILALVLGPVVAGIVGVSGIFDLTAVMAAAAIPLVIWGIPDAPKQSSTGAPASIRAALADPQLLRLDAGIFLLHATMTAVFVASPLALERTLGLAGNQHWKIWLPLLLVSIIPVFSLFRIVERRGIAKPMFKAAVTALTVAMLLATSAWQSKPGLIAALFLFFLGFNYLEGALPSMISRRVPPERKGAALGVYSSAQFLGGFAGGSLSGITLGHFGVAGVYATAGALAAIWLIIVTPGASGLTVADSAIPAREHPTN
ncbi:MAG: MFS transporter [Nevskia sp.]|nr:MFS transporter [Nevskia sp.]